MMTIKATLTVDTPQPADPAVDKHTKALRPRASKPTAETMRQETDTLLSIVQQLAVMGHSTSIAAQLLQISHAQLITKLREIKRGRLVTLAPCTMTDAKALRDMLSRLPSTAEDGLALMQRALAVYGRDGIGTLKSLSEYLGVSYAILHRWRTEPPKRIKIEYLLALQRLVDRGVVP